jgi:hypothetical protein
MAPRLRFWSAAACRRFSSILDPSLATNPSRNQTASRVARRASLVKIQSPANWSSAAVLFLVPRISPSFQRRAPRRLQRYWLAEPGSTGFRPCKSFVLTYGLFGWRFCAAAVAVGAPSSELSSAEVLAAPLNADRSTSFAKKFFPSIGTIMICSLSDSRSAMIF